MFVRLKSFCSTHFPKKIRRVFWLQQVAFTFDTLPELFLAYRQRKAKGMLPVWCINHCMTISLYYRDPDGNMLETQYDTMDNE